MRAANVSVRWWPWGGLLLLAAASCLADDAPPAPDASLEIVQYKTPAGWQKTDQPGQAVRIFTAPDSNAAQQATILMLLKPAQDPLDLRATFIADMKSMIGNDK